MGFEPDGVTLLRVSKDTLTGLRIGPIMDENRAYRRSLQLDMALCRRAKATAKEATVGEKRGQPAPRPAPSNACSKRETKLLEYRFDHAP